MGVFRRNKPQYWRTEITPEGYPNQDRKYYASFLMIAGLWGKLERQSHEGNGSWGVGAQGSFSLRCNPPTFPPKRPPVKEIPALLSSCNGKESQVTSPQEEKRSGKRWKGKSKTLRERGEDQESKREEKEENHIARKADIWKKRFRKQQDVEIKKQLKQC